MIWSGLFLTLTCSLMERVIIASKKHSRSVALTGSPREGTRHECWPFIQFVAEDITDGIMPFSFRLCRNTCREYFATD